MFDTRTPDSALENYWSLSAQLNSLYARLFGYDFIFYLDDHTDIGQNAVPPGEEGPHALGKTGATCYLNGSVPRGAPWGKLPAVCEALTRGYGTVVYIDSDAFFRSDASAVSIDAILQRYGADGRATTKGGVDCAEEGVLLWLASNAPWGAKNPNSGLQIWRNQPRAMELLRRWWSIDIAAREHPYEQSAIKRMYKEEQWPISVMEAFRWMDHRCWIELPALHVTGKNRDQRVSVMQQYLGERAAEHIAIQRIDASAIAQRYLE